MSDCDCIHETRISNLEAQDSTIKESLNKFENKLDLILLQISKVAVLEANHGHQNEAIGRAFERIESVEKTLADVNRFVHRTEGMAKMAYILWGALGSGLVMLAIKVMFFMGSHGVTP